MEAVLNDNAFENLRIHESDSQMQRTEIPMMAAKRHGSLDYRPTPASLRSASALCTTFRTTPFARGADTVSADAVSLDTTAEGRTRTEPSARDASPLSASTTASLDLKKWIRLGFLESTRLGIPSWCCTMLTAKLFIAFLLQRKHVRTMQCTAFEASSRSSATAR